MDTKSIPNKKRQVPSESGLKLPTKRKQRVRKTVRIMENNINRYNAVQLHSWREHKVPKWGYSITKEELDPEKTVKASGREVRVSHKSAREICKTIKGMMLTQAKQYLKDVMDKKRAVPFTRFKKKAGHHRGLGKAYAGRYPTKASKQILRVIEGAEANAEFKGLDTERLRIIHASAYPGMKIKRFTPRAQGRATPSFDTVCHIEIVLEERPEKGEEA